MFSESMPLTEWIPDSHMDALATVQEQCYMIHIIKQNKWMLNCYAVQVIRDIY